MKKEKKNKVHQDTSNFAQKYKIYHVLMICEKYLSSKLIFSTPIQIAYEQVIPFSISGFLLFMRPNDKLSDQISPNTQKHSFMVAILCLTMAQFFLPLLSLFIVIKPSSIQNRGFNHKFGEMYTNLRKTRSQLA